MGPACCWGFELLVLSGAVAACTERDRPLVEIEALDRSGDPRGPEVAAGLEPRLETAASELPGFERRAARADEVGYQLRGEVHLLTERPSVEEGKVHRAAGVSLRLFALDRSAEIMSNGLSSGEVPPEDGFREVAGAALDQALSRLDAALALRGAKPDEVIAALRSEDDALRAAAISAAGERELEATVPALGELLGSDTLPDSVRLDIIGALVAIGDPAAVGPIIDTVDQQPLGWWPQILFAVAELGGPRAEGFLFTVAQGHDDPRIRQAARDALAELEGRKAPPPLEVESAR